MKNAAIIAAGGAGLRMGASLPKQFLPLARRPILFHTLAAFTSHPLIDTVCVVLPAVHRAHAENILHDFAADLGPATLILADGGPTRQQSVYNGLQLLEENFATILVHDGARPLVDAATISRVIQAVAEHGAAIAAVPVVDTLKKAQKTRIMDTIDRDELWQAQTPQGATADLLHKAYNAAKQNNFVGTDEASLLEHAGIAVTITQGSISNIKVTNPADLEMAEAILQQRTGRLHKSMPRVGHGYDAHRLTEGRPLILAGVAVPHDRGLAGHSDADVLAHALCDAILGAVARGDIGSHFPDTDPEYAGADGLTLLQQVVSIARAAGYLPANCDITVVAQAPKLAPYIEEMRHNIARVTGLPYAAVSIKATTTERMGFPGRGEGIAAHAVTLLEPTSLTDVQGGHHEP